MLPEEDCQTLQYRSHKYIRVVRKCWNLLAENIEPKNHNVNSKLKKSIKTKSVI